MGLNQRRFLDTDGQPTRVGGRITARYLGPMIDVDVKKVGAIRDGGGRRFHGRGSAQIWNVHVHQNYHRPRSACHDQPPATRSPARVTNVMRSNI